MDEQKWLDDVRTTYRRYKMYCERAAEQVSDKDFFSSLGGNPQSIATLMKHLGGNHRSRWRDFFDTDGEKRDRNRDREFIVEGETRKSIYENWEEGWQVAFETLENINKTDLDRLITIRGKVSSVPEAIQRNLTHVAYHTGQIVHLARQFVGENWQTLSIAIGKSKEYNSKMQEKYGDWYIKEDQKEK
jgi:uncharacterized damage-inducible protein DinB